MERSSTRQSHGRARRSPLRKLLLSIGVLGAAASIAGLGTFATFTSSTSASHTVSSGTVVVALGTTGSVSNRLTVNASAIAPGDTIQRSVDVINNGTIDFASTTLTTTAPTSSLLDTDTSTGLQMVIEKCTVAWTESGPPYTYACTGGTRTTLIASRPIIGSNLDLTLALSAGVTAHVLFTLTFPSGAGNSLQNQSSTINYAFTGTQRAATNK